MGVWAVEFPNFGFRSLCKVRVPRKNSSVFQSFEHDSTMQKVVFVAIFRSENACTSDSRNSSAACIHQTSDFRSELGCRLESTLEELLANNLRILSNNFFTGNHVFARCPFLSGSECSISD